jgi:hypothetical protein
LAGDRFNNHRQFGTLCRLRPQGPITGFFHGAALMQVPVHRATGIAVHGEYQADAAGSELLLSRQAVVAELYCPRVADIDEHGTGAAAQERASMAYLAHPEELAVPRQQANREAIPELDSLHDSSFHDIQHSSLVYSSTSKAQRLKR